MSKESLELFAHLLSQVRIGPLDQNADADFAKVVRARDELKKALDDLTTPDPQ